MTRIPLFMSTTMKEVEENFFSTHKEETLVIKKIRKNFGEEENLECATKGFL